MQTAIYYFSGTGNSLYVVQELQRRIPDAMIIPIIGLINNEVIEVTAQTVGLVFPVHLATIPLPVRLFIKKLKFQSNHYLFAVATRGGTIHRAFIELNHMLRTEGHRLDAYFTLNFYDNNPRFENYPIPNQDELFKAASLAQADLDKIQKVILNREVSREKDTTFTKDYGMLYRWFLPLFAFLAKYPGSNDDFYADANCTGCGICEQVCLSDKITMTDDQPVWHQDIKCYSCRACLTYCPTQSVQIKDTRMAKSYTSQNGRYPHPFATAHEIAQQKQIIKL